MSMSDDDSIPRWVLETAVAAGSVIAVIGALYYIGLSYEFDPIYEAEQGGEILVYALIGFILFMAAVGLLIAMNIIPLREEDGNAT